MSDIALFLERLIAAPPTAVWRVLTDLESYPRVLSGVVRIERVTGPGYATGTRWLETRTMLGRELTVEMEVVASHEHHSTTVALEIEGMAQRAQFWLQPEEGATLLHVRSSASLSALPWTRRMVTKALTRVTAGLDRDLLLRELDDIARAAEMPDAQGALTSR